MNIGEERLSTIAPEQSLSGKAKGMALEMIHRILLARLRRPQVYLREVFGARQNLKSGYVNDAGGLE